MKKILKPVKITLGILLSIALLGALVVFGLDAWVRLSTKDRILPPEAAELQGADCILVLGCGVWADGQPSHMLEDRLRRSVELYELGAAPKLLMSGDHGRVDYNEVQVMKDYALAAGIASEDVFMDHAGFSTYESLYRARDIFCAQKVIIVSQGYHLYRALFIARALGLEAYGVSADYRGYTGQTMREIREILARCKDVVTSVLMPEPTYLGEQIPITGSGDATND